MDEQEPLHVTLQNLRHDLTALTILVQFLYGTHFSLMPNGKQQFALLRKTIMDVYEEAAEGETPSNEAGVMNSAASMLGILNSIAARIGG